MLSETSTSSASEVQATTHAPLTAKFPSASVSEKSFRSTASAASNIPKAEPVILTRQDGDLCLIKKNSAVPLDGELKLQSVERADGGRSYWIRSSSCPDELYSIVSFDQSGRIDQEVHCERTNLTELSLKSGLQFNIDISPPDEIRRPIRRPMAISGPGRFLVNCPDDGLVITRDGDFRQESGSLVNSEGCVAWRLAGARSRGGEAVRLRSSEELDDSGCSLTSHECLDIVEPDANDADAFNFKTKKSLSVLNERGLRRNRNSKLFHQALEDLDSVERSLTGIQAWETLAPVHLPTNCP